MRGIGSIANREDTQMLEIMRNVWTVQLNRTTGGPDERQLYIAPGKGTHIVPFKLKRLFFMITPSVPGESTQGHAHRKGWQLHFCTFGKVVFTLNDKVTEKEVTLEPNGVGLVIGKGVWHSYKMLTSSSLVALASNSFKETDYIRDFDEFKTGVHWKKP